MKSIVSGGGPLVCVESDVVSRWRGVTGSVKPHPHSDSASPSDYERACNVRDYLGKVPVGDRDALVLGDMPLETLIWKPLSELPRIVRVYYSDPGVDVTALPGLRASDILSDPDEALSVEFKSSPIVVFDSAYPGSDVSNVDRLSFDMPQGTYIAMTKRFEPDDRTSILIHYFLPSQ